MRLRDNLTDDFSRDPLAGFENRDGVRVAHRASRREQAWHVEKETDFRSALTLWCERGDSNPHGFTRQILSLVRLPIPPLSHPLNYTKRGNPRALGLNRQISS